MPAKQPIQLPVFQKAKKTAAMNVSAAFSSMGRDKTRILSKSHLSN
jgi:hypothetical protein